MLIMWIPFSSAGREEYFSFTLIVVSLEASLKSSGRNSTSWIPPSASKGKRNRLIKNCSSPVSLSTLQLEHVLIQSASAPIFCLFLHPFVRTSPVSFALFSLGSAQSTCVSFCQVPYWYYLPTRTREITVCLKIRYWGTLPNYTHNWSRNLLFIMKYILMYDLIKQCWKFIVLNITNIQPQYKYKPNSEWRKTDHTKYIAW